MASFDPLCLFLLKGDRASLFERANARDELTYRCKGCRSLLPRWERVEHGEAHVREQRRLETARREELTAQRIANMARARAAKREVA